LSYSERVAVPPAELQAMLPPKEALNVFAEVHYKHGAPNYMPESVMRMLRQAGFTQHDIEGDP